MLGLAELCKDKCWEFSEILNLLTIRKSIDIFGTEKCEVTFGLKYMFMFAKLMPE